MAERIPRLSTSSTSCAAVSSGTRTAHANLSPMASGDAPTTAPVDDGVDVSLIRWMLSLSADERLAVLQGFADSVAAVTDDSTGT